MADWQLRRASGEIRGSKPGRERIHVARQEARPMLHLYCRCGTDWMTTVSASITRSGDTWTGRCPACKLDLEAWGVAGPRNIEVRTHGFYPHVPRALD